jgi:phage terminase small subunit
MPRKKLPLKVRALGKTKELTPRQHAFVQHYIGGVEGAVRWNGAAAAREAGYSVNSANRIASVLLRNPRIKALIDQVKNKITDQTNAVIALAGSKTQQAMAAVAYFDPREMVHNDGTPKTLKELDAVCAQAVAGFKTTVRWEGKGNTRRKIVETEYRLVNRVAALDMAAKVTGEYKTDNEQRRSARQMTDVEIHERLAVLMGRAQLAGPDGTVPPEQ